MQVFFAEDGQQAILCAYPLDLVARSPATFDQICSLHTHVSAPSERQRPWTQVAAPAVPIG